MLTPIIICGNSKVKRSNTCWVQEFVNLTKLWQHHFSVIFFKNSQSKKITNIFFYYFHVLMMWVKDDYHHVMGLKSEYVFIKARNGASSPSMPCHASYIKFWIEITSNQRLKKGLHCADFFLQVGDQCIGQQPKTIWLVQNALIYHHVKSEYVFIKARNGASSPSMSCHASYIKFWIEITSNQRLKKGLYCADFFLQDGDQCIRQQPKTIWWVQNALIYHKQQLSVTIWAIAQVWPSCTRAYNLTAIT